MRVLRQTGRGRKAKIHKRKDGRDVPECGISINENVRVVNLSDVEGHLEKCGRCFSDV